MMEKEYIAVEVIFNNLDYIIIPAKYFHTLKAETVTFMGAKEIYFELIHETNIDAMYFEGDIFSIEVGNLTLFERFRLNDIMQIKFVYFDRHCEAIYALREDEDSDVKSFQSVELIDDGRLIVKTHWYKYGVMR